MFILNNEYINIYILFDLSFNFLNLISIRFVLCAILKKNHNFVKKKLMFHLKT